MKILCGCGQKAVVVYQTANEVDGVTGTHMGIGNAQRAVLGTMPRAVGRVGRHYAIVLQDSNSKS